MHPLLSNHLPGDIVSQWQQALERCCAAVDNRLVSLCDQRLRATLALAPPQPAPDDELSLAVCDLCEQFAVDVANIRGEQIERLKPFLDDTRIHALLYAIYLLDMQARLELVAPEVLE